MRPWDWVTGHRETMSSVPRDSDECPEPDRRVDWPHRKDTEAQRSHVAGWQESPPSSLLTSPWSTTCTPRREPQSLCLIPRHAGRTPEHLQKGLGVCMCACTYAHVCLHVWMCACVCALMCVCACVCALMYMCVYMYMCECLRVHVCACVCALMHMCICVYMCVLVCVYLCMCIDVSVCGVCVGDRGHDSLNPPTTSPAPGTGYGDDTFL